MYSSWLPEAIYVTKIKDRNIWEYHRLSSSEKAQGPISDAEGYKLGPRDTEY